MTTPPDHLRPGIEKVPKGLKKSFFSKPNSFQQNSLMDRCNAVLTGPLIKNRLELKKSQKPLKQFIFSKKRSFCLVTYGHVECSFYNPAETSPTWGRIFWAQWLIKPADIFFQKKKFSQSVPIVTMNGFDKHAKNFQCKSKVLSLKVRTWRKKHMLHFSEK